jgi:sulfite exporter TauE/SafE
MHIIIAAALAGILATPHCAAMCGGFATACARPRRGLAGWHAGRLATYAALGAIAGTVGGSIPGPAWLPGALATGFLVWFAAALAGIAPQPVLRVPGLARAARWVARHNGVAARAAFGSLTGLLPCGMVYAALGMALAAGAAFTGAGVMLAFGAATIPGLTALSIGLQRIALRSLWTRRAVALLILFLGLWSISMRTSPHLPGPRLDHAHQPH